MSVEMINAKDRIPSNVLSNGAVRYGVYDENGALVRYEYIKREDEPVEAGTNVNKVLFNTIDNNFLATLSRMGLIDKYNLPTITQEVISGTNDIIPKEWETVTEYLKYKNGDIILEGSSIYGTRPENYSADKAVDGDINTYWQGLRNEGTNILTIDFGVKYKITKMKTYISCYGSNFGTCYIEGSTDNDTWNELYSFTSKQTELTELVLNNVDYYRYYRIRHKTSGTSNASYIYEWQVSEWSKINNILNLNNDIENYETNQRALVSINSIENVVKGDIIPKEWVEIIEGTSYKNNNINLTASAYYINPNYTTTSTYSVMKACDGNENSNWRPHSNNSKGHWLMIEFPNKKKITKMYLANKQSNVTTYISATYSIQGSNNNIDWITLYENTERLISEEITLENTDYYKYYRYIILDADYGDDVGLYELKVTEYIQQGLESQNDNYININNLGNKLINNFEGSTGLYELIYNGESFDYISYKNEIDKIKQAIVDLGGVL